MVLLLGLLSTILVFALTRNEQSVSPPTTMTTTSTATPKSCPHSDTSMPGTIEPPTTTTTISTTTTKSCPHSGYQLYPEFNCYKVFYGYKTWSEARNQCVRDGGDLMVMETEQERNDVYFPLLNRLGKGSYPWMGVYKPEGEDGWMTVNGEPALRTWWQAAFPIKIADHTCAVADYNGLLVSWYCAEKQTFFCEISL